MLKAFRVSGRAINKRGHTVDITQNVTATSDIDAVDETTRLAIALGLFCICIVLVCEVCHA